MMIHLMTARLARWQIRTLTISGSVLWLTGIAWLLLHRFGQLQGEFGPETNPAEPWMLRIHGAAVIFALVGLGTLLVVHVWKGWAYARQRLLGLILLAVVVVLIVTGYLLYYVGNESLRAWVSVIHWAIGLALPLVFVLHYKRGIKLRGKSKAVMPVEAGIQGSDAGQSSGARSTEGLDPSLRWGDG